MQFQFVPMNAEYAHHIHQNWHYDGPYRFYDYANSQSLLQPENWADGLFAVLNAAGELVGEYTLWFEDRIMWVGFGLKPELTGQGLGAAFVKAGIEFGVETYQYTGEEVRLSVAAFNQRAIKVYQRLGFTTYACTTEQIRGKDYEFFHMTQKRA